MSGWTVAIVLVLHLALWFLFFQFVLPLFRNDAKRMSDKIASRIASAKRSGRIAFRDGAGPTRF